MSDIVIDVADHRARYKRLDQAAKVHLLKGGPADLAEPAATSAPHDAVLAVDRVEDAGVINGLAARAAHRPKRGMVYAQAGRPSEVAVACQHQQRR